MSKYTVLRDTQEKNNYWTFDLSSYCCGTFPCKLPTGDYTLKGYEDILSIERKYSTGEFSGNVSEKRFYRELERLDKFPHPYLVCEFTYDDLLRFPANSTIPPKYWSKLKTNPSYLIKCLVEIEINYKVKVILAGDNAYHHVENIFKYIHRKYQL